MLDLTRFIASCEDIIASHAMTGCRAGSYRRWNWQDHAGDRDLGLNEYGCADAANILYTIGRFPAEPAERAGWVEVLQSLQAPETGLFTEATHHTIHTTAHCIAALELFDARPLRRLAGLDAFKTPTAVRDFLSNLDWRANPWRESHRGAGLYASLVITEEVDAAWQDAYFDWLWEHTDPATGLLGARGAPDAPLPRVTHTDTTTMVPHMAGTFHYLFNMQWAKRPSRYPDKLIDACLDMLAEGQFPLGERIGFAEIDWFFCMNRSMRQTDHRFLESRRAIESLGRRLFDFVQSLDPASDDGLNDLHLLFGVLCAFAELQQSLPGLLRTARPLKLVLDRRPFI